MQLTLQGTQPRTLFTRYCISHEDMRPVEGGCELGTNQWVCSHCWQRRRLTRGAQGRATAPVQAKPDPASDNHRADRAHEIVERTRQHWGLDLP